MKKIYNFFFYLLIFYVQTCTTNVECNDIINYNGLYLRNKLLTNNIDVRNRVNNSNDSFTDSKIDLNENNTSQNNAHNISSLGKHITIIGTDSPQKGSEISRPEETYDKYSGLSVTDSGIADGSAFGGGFSLSEKSPLQGGWKKCPNDIFCKGIDVNPNCPKRTYEERNNNWTILDVKKGNEGLIVPPRRKKLCFGNISKRGYRVKSAEKLKNLKNELIQTAFTEAVSIWKMYEKHPEYIHSAMKYSFADMEDIVKGNDIIDDTISKNISSNLDKIFKNGDQTNVKEERKKWWNGNKSDIWNSMMCAYMKEKKDNKCPGHDDMHEVPQVFRWFREWGSHVCKDIKKNREDLKAGCKNNVNGTPDSLCSSVFKYYENIINSKRSEWKIFVKHFDGNKSSYPEANESTPEKYLNDKCPECDCDKLNLKNIFENEYNIQTLLNEINEQQASEQVSTLTSEVVQHTNLENSQQSPALTPQESQSQQQEQRQEQRQEQNIHRVSNNDNILGWEFGPVSVPGTNPYISSEEKNSLELINLTSWDKEDIIKQNEDIRDEIEEQQQDIQEDEEGFESDLNEGAETNEEDQNEILEEDEEEEEEEEEDEDEVEENIEEEKEKKDRENSDSEEQEKEVKENEQDTEKENERKKVSMRDADEHQILSVNYKNNNDLRKGAESIVKKLFSLFNENNNLETMFKDLTKDMTSLFQQ